jgi:hypothetical protein
VTAAPSEESDEGDANVEETVGDAAESFVAKSPAANGKPPATKNTVAPIVRHAMSTTNDLLIEFRFHLQSRF